MAGPTYVFPPPAVPSLPVVGTTARFAVRRIFCVGRNYAEHTREMCGDAAKEPPFFFSKPADATVDCSLSSQPGVGLVTVTYPCSTSSLHHEGELVLAIGGDFPGGQLGNLSREAAVAATFGVAVGVDLTRRDLQAEAKKTSRPWDTSKGFDDSAPMGAILPLAALQERGLVLPGHDGESKATLCLGLSVDGARRQWARLADMLWNCADLVQELAKLYDLRSGDLIFTGTPAGVAALVPGNVVEVCLTAEDSVGGNDVLATCSFRVGEPANR